MEINVGKVEKVFYTKHRGKSIFVCRIAGEITSYFVGMERFGTIEEAYNYIQELTW